MPAFQDNVESHIPLQPSSDQSSSLESVRYVEAKCFYKIKKAPDNRVRAHTYAILVAGTEVELEKGIKLLPETQNGFRMIHLYDALLMYISIIY